MAAELVPGALVTANLRLVRQLGRGGMGSVWIADHLALRTQVVVKFMSDELAQNQDALGRFSREAAAASQVKSPHVVHMIDYGIASNGLPFIAMEFLEGKDLSQVIARHGSLNPESALKIVTHVARALGRAHEKGIIHRDIKPENIFLIDAGGGEIFAKVLDFGIAKAALADVGRSTGTGLMVGTPLYMSPEQVLGSKAIDHRADLWSLGVVAFEALTGSVPFAGETVGAISVAICHAPIPSPSQRNPALGPAIDAWFARACERDLAKRFASAKELADALGIAIASDQALGHEQTVISRPAIAAASLPHGAATPALTPTMVEVDEPTMARPLVVAGHATTNGATSSRGPAAPLSGQPTRRIDRRTMVGLGLAGAVAVAVTVVVAVLAMHSDPKETTAAGSPPPPTGLRAPPSATTPPVATASSPKIAPSTDVVAEPPASSAAPIATVVPSSSSTSPVPAWTAPASAKTAPPKPTTSSAPSSEPTKPKGKPVVIE